MSGAAIRRIELFGAALLVRFWAFGVEPSGADWRARIAAWRSAHEVEIVKELADFVAIPNLASDRPNVEKNAERAMAILAARGIHAELLRVPEAPPVFFGELDTPGAKATVVFYAHYDGQPVEPKDWSGSPYQPVLREGPLGAAGREIGWGSLSRPLDPEWRLYGRSSSDDKAPLVGWMAALDALRASGIPLSVNVRFFLEGEEEAGSPHLSAYLEKYADRLRGDLWLLCDGPVHQSRRMQVFFGARGVTTLGITTYGATRRLHSGHYGNWSPNPIAELVALLASMRDTDGFVHIAGFDKDVRPLSAAERRALAEVPDVGVELARELQIGRAEGRGERLAEAIQRPALNFQGVRSGEVGAAATNSIPTEATASIDFRLVPDQTPDRVREAVEAHVRARGYFVVHDAPDAPTRRTHPRVAWLQWGSGYPGYRTPMDLPAGRAVLSAVEEATGGPVVKLPSLGGSIPMALFAEKLGTPIIGIPIANHDNNQHAANENLRLKNLWDGIEVYAGLFARLGTFWK
jgi:acetylornithine deacetylase/succinyl-diaminopimelate desuccinylase-like protein